MKITALLSHNAVVLVARIINSTKLTHKHMQKQIHLYITISIDRCKKTKRGGGATGINYLRTDLFSPGTKYYMK